MKKPFVISISGVSGGGKTTITNALKDHLSNSTVVSFDDYDDIKLDRDINEWSADGNDENEWYVEPLAKDIERLLKEPFNYIIIDYPFGYRNQRVGEFINFAIFVDTPLDVALARRTIRDYTSRPTDSDFGIADVEEVSLESLDKELRFYLERSRPTYARMPDTQKPYSDLVVDGMKSPAEIADGIVNVLCVRNHYDALIDEINDPARDLEPLKAYMDKWDGEAFIEALQLSPDKSVLEIGVGTGRLAVRVCNKCKDFTGIDISPKTVERAKENLRDYPNVRLIHGDFLSYSFNEAFDIIYSSLTFLHIKDKRSAIKKTADLLSPGGRFVLSIEKEQRTVLDFGTRKIELYPDTPEEIIALLIEAGLSIEKQFETEFAVVFAAMKGAKI